MHARLSSNEIDYFGFILDFNRCMRSRKTLDHLTTLAAFPNSFGYLFDSHKGSIKQYLPYALKEILGVYHIKYLLFDEEVILTGANLSLEYFTLRIDRYYVFKTPFILNSIIRIFELFATSSKAISLCPCKPFKPLASFDNNSKRLGISDTRVIITLRSGCLGIDQESSTFSSTLKYIEKNYTNSNIYFMTPYFNNTEFEKLISHNQHQWTFITGAIESCGFFNGTGVRKLVPFLYHYSFGTFLKNFNSHNSEALSFYKPHHTFHAKGLFAKDAYSLMTIIGSSNYGRRSLFLDSDIHIYIFTTNKRLSTLINFDLQRILIDTKAFNFDDNNYSFFTKLSRFLFPIFKYWL